MGFSDSVNSINTGIAGRVIYHTCRPPTESPTLASYLNIFEGLITQDAHLHHVLSTTSTEDQLYALQQELSAKIQSLEAELTQYRCVESQLIGERDEANAAVSAECMKVSELEKLVDRQARQLDSLNAEVQVS